MKNSHRIQVTSLAASFLFVSLPMCVGQRSMISQRSQITQIAMMFHQGKSEHEIITAWESFFRSNPKTNVDWALSFLRQEVQRHGAENIQKARQQLVSARKLQEALRTELNSVRSTQKRGATTAAERVHKKNFEYNGKEVVIRDAGLADRATYIQELSSRLDSVATDIQLADTALHDLLQKQQQSITLANTMSERLHGSATTVISHIKD